MATILEVHAPLASGGGGAAGPGVTVSAAARSVLAVLQALPTVWDIVQAFRDTDCSTAIVSLLSDATLPTQVIAAACRAAWYLLPTAGGTAAFKLAGGPAALVSLLQLRRTEPSVVIAVCEALSELVSDDDTADVLAEVMASALHHFAAHLATSSLAGATTTSWSQRAARFHAKVADSLHLMQPGVWRYCGGG